MMKFALPPKLDDPSNQFGPNEYINAQIRETQKEMISKHAKWLDDRIRKVILDRIGEDIPLEEISHRLVEFRKENWDYSLITLDGLPLIRIYPLKCDFEEGGYQPDGSLKYGIPKWNARIDFYPEFD